MVAATVSVSVCGVCCCRMLVTKFSVVCLTIVKYKKQKKHEITRNKI